MTTDPEGPGLPPPDHATPAQAGPQPPPASPPAVMPRRYPVLSNRAISWAAIVLIIIGVGLAVVLLIAFGNGQHPDQLDAIKTAGTIVVGTGGAAALWLTARRQQTSEIALNQKHLDQIAAEQAFAFQQQQAADTRAHLQRVAAATEADAEARRITDLYTKAADQLGSDKAPVRLAGLYALERLAQDNPGQRQTIVNVICAYLRMPYTPPTDKPTAHRLGARRPRHHTPGTSSAAAATSRRLPAAAARTDEEQQRRQEREVRLTAQRILTTHLRPGKNPHHPVVEFWPHTGIDLTGATLINFNLVGCHLNIARFDGAQFTGDAGFAGAQFTRNARFNGARFTGNARFDGAQFTGNARFDEAQFTDYAWFDEAQFTGNARFDGAQFTGEARFTGARFTGIALFDGARFTGEARFDDARFDGGQFIAGAQFDGAQFTAGADFDPAANLVTRSAGCWVRLDIPDEHTRRWPDGWMVVATAERPDAVVGGEWGRLERQPTGDPNSGQQPSQL
ncbi:MAG TPA: pentapeptide repeat-containing protein [Pseudonocardiaceae bacterium]|nr:pentapeptide repeat-containing protein [Pseudonocardiaceae bacterium]